MENNKEIIQELFFSNSRKDIDNHLKNIVESHIEDSSDIENILYGLNLDNKEEVTIEHSKRLRGNICYKISKVLNISNKEALDISIYLETIHQVSLIIDDIQDKSPERCGRPSLYEKVGIYNATVISHHIRDLVQGYLLEESEKHPHIVKFLLESNKTIQKMVLGQNMDTNSNLNLDKGVEYYLKTIKGKTGVLLCLAFEAPFIVIENSSNYPLEKENFLMYKDLFLELGYLLGVSHQIEDDLDDITSLILKEDIKIDYSNILNFIAYKEGLIDENYPKNINPSNFYNNMNKSEKEKVLQLANELKNTYDNKLDDVLMKISNITTLDNSIKEFFYNLRTILIGRNERKI